MTDRQLSTADAALRERLTELGLHIPLSGVAAPMAARSSGFGGRVFPRLLGQELPLRFDG